MTLQDKARQQNILTFRLNGEDYGLDIMSVREIRGWSRATTLPHAPDYVLGVINLRGTVLPVLDLRSRLGFEGASLSERSVVLVTHHQERLTGLLVDAVSDIITVPVDDLQPPPTLPSQEYETMLTGMTLIQERLIRVLDLPKVLGASGDLAA